MKDSINIAFAGIGVAGITIGLVGPVTVILLETHGTPGWITGAVTTMLYLSVVLFSSLTGRLVDRYRIKRVMSAGYIITLVSSLGLIFWRNYYILFPVRFLMGVGFTFIFITTEILINALSDETNRGKNISGYVVYLSAGIALGTFLIWTVNIAEWLPFIIGSAMILAAFLLELRYLDDIHIRPADEKVSGFPITGMPAAAVLSAAIYGICESSLTVVIPLFGLRSGFSQTEVSWFLSAYVIGGILLLYLIGKFSDRISKYDMLLYISVTLVLFLTMTVISLNMIYLTVLFFLLGGVVPAFYTVGLAYTIEKVDPQYMAQANGHFAMAYGMGTLAGPMIGTALIDVNLRYGFWIASAGVCFLFYLYFRFIYRERRIEY